MFTPRIDLDQSVRLRARLRTLAFFHRFWFWVAEVVSVAAAGALTGLWVYGNDWLVVWQTIVPTVAAVMAPFAVLGLVFAGSLVVAPIQQRNEARLEVRRLADPRDSVQKAIDQLKVIGVRLKEPASEYGGHTFPEHECQDNYATSSQSISLTHSLSDEFQIPERDD